LYIALNASGYHGLVFESEAGGIGRRSPHADAVAALINPLIGIGDVRRTAGDTPKHIRAGGGRCIKGVAEGRSAGYADIRSAHNAAGKRVGIVAGERIRSRDLITGGTQSAKSAAGAESRASAALEPRAARAAGETGAAGEAWVTGEPGTARERRAA